MPMYHVKCKRCGAEDDVIVSRYLSDGEDATECELCGGVTQRDGVELCARTPKAWAGYLLSDM